MNAVPRESEERTPTVLVVDDDEVLGRAVERILRREGIRCVRATSSREALRAVDELDHLDLVLCDLVLPDLDGREVANLLLARQPDLKVVFMSGYSSYGSGRRQVQEGGWAFLEKPFESEGLVRAVQSALAG